MNKIFTLVWSAARSAFIVAHEHAKSHGKPSSSRSGATTASLLLGLLGNAGFALAGPPVAPPVNALPTGGQVAAGAASITQSANRMDINQSTQKAILNWQSFNIGADAQVNFAQPSASAVALNRVLSSDPSAIYGKLNSNGQVFLLNPNGVLFGAGARVDVGGLVASTMKIDDADFMAGNYKFSGGSGAVINQGSLTAAQGGYIALLSPEVRNEGVISASLGTVLLGGAEAVTLSHDSSGLSYAVDKGAVQALVDNKGLVQADGGQVLLSARAANELASAVINNSGTIEAKGLVAKGGRIVLEADSITLASGSRLDADAASGSAGAGGTISVIANLNNSASQTKVDGTLTARGGELGGDGGFIETSGSTVELASSVVFDTRSPKGATGLWLLDPYDYAIGSTQAANIVSALSSNNVAITTTASTTNYGSNGNNASTGNIAVSSPISSSSANNLSLTAAGTITVNSGAAISVGSLTLSGSTGIQLGSNITTTGAQSYTGALGLLADLTLTSSNNGAITFNNSVDSAGPGGTYAAALTSGSSWTVPSAVTTFKVWAIGAGGGGAGAIASDGTSGGGGGAGGIAYKTFTTSSGSVSYSLGGGGTYGTAAASGSGGGGTTVTYGSPGTSISASGGGGGNYQSTTAAAGGTGSGGDGSATGGTGAGASGDMGGGGGGGIGGGAGTTNGSAGGTGGTSRDVSGLQAALALIGYSIGTGAGAGASSGSSNINNMNGSSATGFGSGGGGGGWYGGNGGSGYLGGGGGGAGGFSGTQYGGTGGNGAVVVSYTLAGTTALTINAGSGNVSFNGAAGANSGLGVLTVNSTGTTTFAGAVKATSVTTNANGSTLINGASVYTSGNQTYNDAVTLGAGTTLTVTDTSASKVSFASTLGGAANALTVTGNASFGGAVTNLSTLSVSGTTDLNASVTSSGTQTYSGAVTLGADTTLTGSTIAPASTVNLASYALTLANSASSTMAGVISGSGTLTKSGSGTLTLSAANTYTGATTVSGGTLAVSNATGLGTTAGGATVASGATLDLQNVAVGAEPITLSGGTLKTSTGSSSLSGNVALGADSAADVGGTALTLSGIVSGSFGLSKAGTGTLTLSAANTYTGATTVSGGTLVVSNASGLGTTAGATTVVSGATLDLQNVVVGAEAITLNGGTLKTSTGSSSLAGAVTLGAASSIDSSGTALTLTGGITNAGYLSTFSGAGSTSLSSTKITGTGGLTKTGSGTLTLSAADDYSGATTISAGTVKAGSASALGSSAVSVAIGAALDLNGQSINNNLSIGGTGISSTGALLNSSGSAASDSGTVSMSAATSIGGGGDITLSGVLSGGYALTKVGSATLTLSGTNTYNGGSTVSAGTLKAGSTAALGSGAATVSSGGALDLNGNAPSNNFTISGSGVSNGGALINSTTGTGGTVSGTLALGAMSSIGGSGNLTIAGQVTTGSGNVNGLVFVGAGAKTLSNNTNAIGTIASGSGIGALSVNDASALTAGALTLNAVAYSGINSSNAAVSLTSSVASGTALTLGAISTGTGDLTLTGNTLSASANSSGTGALTIKPYTSATTIGLNGGSGTLSLSSATLAYFTGASWSRFAIGSSAAGAITVSGSNAFNNSPLELITGGNITLNASSNLTTSRANGYLALEASGNFINSSGSTALQATGTGGSWMVYSTTPASDTFGSLNSTQQAIWGKTAGSLSATALKSGYAGNRYVFSAPATVVVTATNKSKTYGDSLTFAAGDIAYSGLPLSSAATYGNLYLNYSTSDALSTLPTASSTGAAASAAVVPGGYAIIPSGAVAYTGFGVSYVNGTLTVNAKPVTLSGSRVYDGTTTLAGSIYSATNLVNSDTLSVGGSATATSPNVGTYTSPSGLTLSNTNYTLTGGSASASITAKTLTLSGLNLTDRAYNGLNTATTVQSYGTLSGKVGNDVVSVTGGTVAAFGGVDAGSYSVGVTGLALSNSNYQLASSSATDSAVSITRKTLTVSNFNLNDRVYDGTTTATTLQGGTLSGVETVNSVLDAVSLSSGTVPAFTSKNVGTYSVTVSGVSLTGGKASNYQLASSTLTDSSVSITPKTLTISGITATGKEYDGNRTVTVSTTGVDATALQTGGLIAGDVVSVSATGIFSDKNAAVGKTVTLTSSYSGADVGNYSIVGQGTALATISAKALTIGGITAANKTYDGTAAATVSSAAATKTGLLAGDVVTVAATGTFADRNAGSKTVTLSSSYGGADVGNYSIAGQASTTATISPKALTVSGITAADKTYDGTTTATVSTAAANKAGLVSVLVSGVSTPDDVTVLATGTFSDKNAGANKVVALASTYGGADVGNYTITGQSNAIATISKAPLTITGITAADKTYDGTTLATVDTTGVTAAVLVTGGKVAGDDVSVTATGTFSGKDVALDGNNAVISKTVTLTSSYSGADVGNYTITDQPNTTAMINKATLTVRANDDAKYVTMADPTFTASYSGFVNGETAATAGLTGTLSVSRSSSGPDGNPSGSSELAGTYSGAISALGLSANNYGFNYVPANFTIVPAGILLVKVNPVSAVYGSAPVYSTNGASAGGIAASYLKVAAGSGTLTSGTLGVWAPEVFRQTRL